jgi:hypothetical protein
MGLRAGRTPVPGKHPNAAGDGPAGLGAVEVIGLKPLVVTQVGGPVKRLGACLSLREVW